MEKEMTQKEQVPSLRDLYPHLSEEQLKEAGENLNRYLEVALRIYERICGDPESYAQFKALTVQERTARINTERSIPKQTEN